MKCAVLTSPDQWFVPYAERFSTEIGATLLFDHERFSDCEIVFILSYHRIIPAEVLAQNRHNLVVHASDLPSGKGWAPTFWQILEGKDEIVFTLFEAGSGVDDGNWYLKETLHLDGFELHDEIRHKQAEATLGVCRSFIEQYPNVEAKEQSGEESFYAKRSPKDGELDIDRSIKEQFDLLRICSNEEYPAWFEVDGRRYVLKIEHDERKMS
jgi:methionyl-tRNA formyltransferase